MATLFFSYSSRDRPLAQRLVTKLSRLGHRISIDTDSLVPGVEWRRELLDKLLLSDGVVVLLTPNALSSPFVLSEIGSARASSKLFLIPVVVGHAPIHPVVQDIWAVPLTSSTETGVSKAARQIDEAVKTHLKRSAKLSGVAIPSGYEHLSRRVYEFCQESPFERNLFVMMKFPERLKMSDRHVRLLEDVFEVIRAEAARHHLLARRADQKHYHDQLWENICVYIIGSKYGIAVLEDEVAAELNPNVALEYGFMKALDHPVALLQWSRFKHVRADLSGKLARTFDIKKGVLHKASLRKAVGDWLREQGFFRAGRRGKRQ
jgi:TIR domain